MSWRDATAFWCICAGKEKSEKQKAPKTGLDAVSQKEAGFNAEVEETGTTFAENAALAFYYKKIL